MSHRIIFDFDDANEIYEAVAAIQRQPRIFYERINYLELYDNDNFIIRFRVSKKTFRILLRLIEEDISPPSLENNAVLAPCKLYMMLRYLATGSFSLTVADFTGMSESSACQYIYQVSRAIARHRPKFIYFPKNADVMKKVISGFYSIHGFPRVVGAVDCTHINIQSPGGDYAETFRNKKGDFSINIQGICNPWLKIMDIVARWPGSCHDQTIFDNSSIKHKFETGVINGYLLGDGDYEAQRYLLIPQLAPFTINDLLYNERHISTRNVIERCFSVLKSRFPVLSKGITANLNDTQAIIVACAIIHNICIDMHDDLPKDALHEEYDDTYITEDDLPTNSTGVEN